MHISTISLALISSAAAYPTWNLTGAKTLVTFGDSYTDETRLSYFVNNNGTAPPPGWDQPVGLTTASGGLSWARYASIYTNSKLYNYAVSGAVCSNDLTPRHFDAINALFPDIQGYEIPAFIADSTFESSNGTKFFTGDSSTTVYAIWIGTNDLGNYAYLTDSQVEGKTLSDFVDCVYSAIDRLYANGGRNFVLLNLAPLQLLPQYQLPSLGGKNATHFWPDKPANGTLVHQRILESVTLTNDVFEYRTPFEVQIRNRWAGIQIANFNVNGLLTDVWTRPVRYLNGTAPLNVTGVVSECDVQGQNCQTADSPDSFLWFDELHPSEQASRVVAREFVHVLGGNSSWAQYW